MLEIDIGDLRNAYEKLQEALNDLRDVESFKEEQYHQLLYSRRYKRFKNREWKQIRKTGGDSIMEIKEMNNEELLRHYACHLKQIDNDYKVKKEFEEEIKSRFNERKI